VLLILNMLSVIRDFLTNRKMMKLTMELIVCVGYFGTSVCKMMSLLLSS